MNAKTITANETVEYRDPNSRDKVGERHSTGNVLRLKRPVTYNDHIRGNDSALVTVLMYGAYECTHCVEGNQIVKELEEHFGETLRFAFRHFPRVAIHPHAEAAAEVAEAAGEQGKFWEMHDTLFANYNRLDGDHLIEYAVGLGLDMERFDRSVTGRAFAGRVQDDLISGTESGVKGTPTYFVNEQIHVGSGEFDALARAIHRKMYTRIL